MDFCFSLSWTFVVKLSANFRNSFSSENKRKLLFIVFVNQRLFVTMFSWTLICRTDQLPLRLSLTAKVSGHLYYWRVCCTRNDHHLLLRPNYTNIVHCRVLYLKCRQPYFTLTLLVLKSALAGMVFVTTLVFTLFKARFLYRRSNWRAEQSKWSCATGQMTSPKTLSTSLISFEQNKLYAVCAMFWSFCRVYGGSATQTLSFQSNPPRRRACALFTNFWTL